MAYSVSVSLGGILAPGGMEKWAAEKKRAWNGAVSAGMKNARPLTDRIMKRETERAFDFSKAGSGKLKTSWRVNVYADRGAPKMVVKNLAKWFAIHTTGGTVAPRTTPRAILIPINTRFGMRIGTKKFYQLITWLRANKWTVVKDGILYVRPPMNESRRGGVAVGTRVQKSFRSRFQGSAKRPSGFDIKLNEHGLTPIAIIRTTIKMKKRMDLQSIAERELVPVVVDQIRAELHRTGLQAV